MTYQSEPDLNQLTDTRSKSTHIDQSVGTRTRSKILRCIFYAKVQCTILQCLCTLIWNSRVKKSRSRPLEVKSEIRDSILGGSSFALFSGILPF
jgi:hypothetical protein